MYQARLYAHEEESDTLEPIGHFQRSKVVKYYRRKRITQPRDLDTARIG